MAKAKAPAAPPENPDSQYSDEACQRLEACEKQKREYELDIREALYFSRPHLAREVISNQAPSDSRPTDGSERQTSIATELARDFLTEVLTAFMPQSDPWAEQRPGMMLPDEVKAKALALAGKQSPIIFDAIRSSNLYEQLPMAWDPYLAVGVAGLWIADPRPSENLVVQPVPIRELEINLGPFGGIDDRFSVRHTRNRHVEAVLGKELFAKLTKQQKRVIKDKPNERTVIRWGFWRKWERLDDVVWQHVVMLDKAVIHATELVGEGACPLIVTRFNPGADWAFADGPLIESLEDLRLLDTLEGDKVDHIELKLRPPTAYPDDSFAAVENGIESASAYPIRAGSEGAVKPIFEGGDIEGALWETSQIEDRLRRKFFITAPQQKGKTPPSATQWIDLMIEGQRRIGTPGMSFWREGPAAIFLRFKYLLEKRGMIEPVKIEGKTVALTPYNPAQRAAEQQEVMMAMRFIQFAGGSFPEEFRMEIDGAATMKAIKEKMRAGLIVFRNAEGKAAAMAMIGKLIEGRQKIDPAAPEAAGGLQ